MDEETSKFLLNWINSNASSAENTVSDIRDDACKNLLLKILHLIDNKKEADLPCERDLNFVQVLSLVISYLKGFHGQDLAAVISSERLQNKNELEIGKVVTLLLCAATQCDNVATFVNQIIEMSVDDQFHFKFLIESVLTEIERRTLTEESFDEILKGKVKLPHVEGHTLDRDGLVSSPVSVQSTVEALFTNSPLKSLVSSPQFRSRQNQVMLNKLQQKVMKLQAMLDSQMHLQSELEIEVTEKNKEIDARDSTILELRKEVTKLMSASDELELMRHFKGKYDKAESEITRLKQKVVELQTFKQQCGDLEVKVAEFIQEKEQFESKRVESERLKSSIERYKTKVHQMEFQTSELEAALSRKEQIISKLVQEMEEMVCSASMSAQMMREMPRMHSAEVGLDDISLEDPSSDIPQGNSPQLNSTKPPVNIDSRIIELELEKVRLTSQLSVCVDQEEYLALKETLADTQETQSSYKEKFIAAKSKTLELEEELTKAKNDVQSSQQNLDMLKEKHEQIKEERDKINLAKTQLQSELERTIQSACQQLCSEQNKVSELQAQMASLATEHSAEKAEIQQQLNNIQEHCFQEVEGLKKALAAERSGKDRVSEELDLKVKKLQQTAVEMEAMTSLKEGLEGSLHTCNARAHDDKLRYDRELESKNQELSSMNKQREALKENLAATTKQIETLEMERNQIRDAYEQMLAEVKQELNLKMRTMKEDKMAALDQFRLKMKQLEEEQDKLKEEFAIKQKLMLAEERENATKLQETLDAEHTAWKRKFDQLSHEAMDTRSEMLQNSKKHSEEIIEMRKAAREREETLNEEARKMREQIAGLENQLLNANNTIAELRLGVELVDSKEKELERKRQELEELKKKCESYVLKTTGLEARLEQLQKDTESEKESLKLQLLNKEAEIDRSRQELENLKKFSELEQRQKEEIEKILKEEKGKGDALSGEINQVKAADEEKRKEIFSLKNELNELEQRKKEEIEKILKEEKEKSDCLSDEMKQVKAADEEKRMELESLRKQLSELKQGEEEAIEKILKEEKTEGDTLFEESKQVKAADDEKGKEIQNLEERLKNACEEKKKAVAELQSSCHHWENKEHELSCRIVQLENAVEEMKAVKSTLEEKVEELRAENERMEQKGEEEALINRRLGTEIHSLEAQLSYADRQIREQREMLVNKPKAQTARRQTIGGLKTQFYLQPPLVEEDSSAESDGSLPLQMEDFANSMTKVKTELSSPLNKSIQSLDYSLSSVYNTSLRTGVQTRASRRQSAIYLCGNTPPERRTTNSAPYFIFGGGSGLKTEQEAENEYDWERITELQRRNASCLPHLQTSYPVETQMQPEVSGQLDIVKSDGISTGLFITRKRKWKSEESAKVPSTSQLNSSQLLPKSKSAPTITPGRRKSSRRIAEAMQSALGSLRSRSNENLSRADQGSEVSSRRESIAFSIDISPPKKTKNIDRRRTISRFTGSSHLLGDKSKTTSKKDKHKKPAAKCQSGKETAQKQTAE